MPGRRRRRTGPDARRNAVRSFRRPDRPAARGPWSAWAAQGGIAGAMGLAEGVTAGNQRDGLLVVHRHARERLADVPRRREGIWIAVRPFRIDVDQAHLHGAERALQVAIARVALVRQPF